MATAPWQWDSSNDSAFCLPDVIRRFSWKFPNARLEFHEDLTDELLQKIIAAELDVGITSVPIKNKLI